MSDYHPDSWVVLKIEQGATPIYKVLGGWSGGYLQGDSWRMNSGITEVEIYGEHYIFRGNSGSEYWCHRSTYGLKMNTAGIYKSLIMLDTIKVDLMDEKTKWSKLKFNE